MAKIRTIREFTGRMRAIRQRLATPKDFFLEHRARYLVLARSSVRQTLQAMRPAETPADEWDRNVERFAAMTTAYVLANPLGMRISVGGQDPADTSADEAIPDYEITYEDVLQWVEAGFDGDPEGKDVSLSETAWEPENIAWNVYDAVRQHRFGQITSKDYSRITARLQEWIHRSTQVGFGEFMLAVGEAWFHLFAPIFLEDFRFYLREVSAKL